LSSEFTDRDAPQIRIMSCVEISEVANLVPMRPPSLPEKKSTIHRIDGMRSSDKVAGWTKVGL